MNNTEISMPIAKASSAIAAAAATKADTADQVIAAVLPVSDEPVMILILTLPWATIAQIAAALYTMLLISEWFWKKLWRPFFERRGWLQPLRRRIITVEEYGEDDTCKAPP